MSREAAVAKRYAKALFELAREQGVVSEVEKQLEALVLGFEEEPAIKTFLDSPDIVLDKKLEVLRAIAGERVAAVLQHTLELIVVRGRQSTISHLYDAYVRIAGEAVGEARALVYTAKELSQQELDAVAVQMGELTRKKIIPKQIVNPSLLGGLQVRIGDRLYDGSLSGKLDRLQKTLNSKAL